MSGTRGGWKLTFAWFLTGCLGSVASAESAISMPVSFSAVLELESRSADVQVRYGNEASQVGTLWLPPGQDRAPRPVVVLVHGGCWLADYNAQHAAPLAQRLARDGYAVWLPEYRRVGEPGGGWPGSAVDLVRSLDALAALDEARLNLGKTILVGHSAGGHLALWLASREANLFPPSLRISGAIGLAAITDLAVYAGGDNSCQAVTSRFMGATPAEAPDAYRLASPAYRELRVPTVLLRGELDRIVDSEQVSAMPGAIAVELPGAGHFDWIHPDTEAYQRLKITIFEMLSSAQADAMKVD